MEWPGGVQHPQEHGSVGPKVPTSGLRRRTIGIVHLPAFVLHPAPLVSFMSGVEMWMGSSTVWRTVRHVPPSHIRHSHATL